MSILNSVMKHLYAKSGNVCAFPGCNNRLVFDKINQSEMAHIISSKVNGPRHIDNYNDGNYDTEDNIIALCLEHHNLIDNDVQNYSIKKLKIMKKQHELYIEQIINNIDSNKEFLDKFIKICLKNRVQELLEQDLLTPFSEYLFDYSDNLYYEIKDLTNSVATSKVEKKIIKDVVIFNNSLSDLYQDASMYCEFKNNGYAVPVNMDYKKREMIRKYNTETLRYLVKIYNKYRYGCE